MGVIGVNGGPRSVWVRTIVGFAMVAALAGLPAHAGPQHGLSARPSAAAGEEGYLAVLSDALRRMQAYREQGQQRAVLLRQRWSSLREAVAGGQASVRRQRSEARLAHVLNRLVVRDHSRRQSLAWARREAAQAWLATQARELLAVYQPIAASLDDSQSHLPVAANSGGRGLWLWPAAGRPRQSFGSFEVDGLRFPRSSIELRVPASSPVVAAADGVVADILRMSDGASSVLIRHDGDDRSRCSGLAGLRVEVGQKVVAGEVIGRARAARGATISFGLRRADVAVDPATLLR